MTQSSKLVPKWVAWLHDPFNHHEKKIRTMKLHVIETAKQFRLQGMDVEYREARAACGYRSLINKEHNTCLFDSELEALEALQCRFADKAERAEAEMNEAQENLFLVHEKMNATSSV